MVAKAYCSDDGAEEAGHGGKVGVEDVKATITDRECGQVPTMVGDLIVMGLGC